jgi:hypothetical protein
MVRIGIKYCGGCNPVIDRTRLVQEIDKLLPPDYCLLTDECQAPWDIGTLVCGCPAACCDNPEIRNLARRWIVVAGGSIDLELTPEEKMAMAIVQKITKGEEHD